MSIFTMPPELHSEILAGLDKEDLLKCATVCKAWNDDSQRHLCAYPVITSERNAKAFKAYLQQSAEAQRGNLVKGLWIRAPNGNRHNPDAWMGAALIELAPLLPHITSLTIQNWGPIAPGSRAIAALRSFKQVTILDLQAPIFNSSTDLEDFVFALPSLSTLRLRDVRWRHVMHDWPLDRRQYRGLPLLRGIKKLELHVIYPDILEPLFHWLERHGCRPSELLAARVHSKDIERLSTYMAFIGEKLRVFNFWPFFQPGEDPAQVTTLLGHNVAVQSLTLRTNDSPGSYVNSWVPELLRSVVGRSLRDITFEMCLDREAALGERLWWDTTQIIQLHWLKTLSSVAFVHEPVQDEAMYHNGASFLLDGTLAFTRYFSRQLSRRGLVVGVRNAPILDLGVYKSNI